MEMCRACLVRNNEIVQIDDLCLQNYNLLTNLAASLQDHLPHCLCRGCWEKLNLFVLFRDQCRKSEASFYEIFDNSYLQDIKEEKNEAYESDNNDADAKVEEKDSYKILKDLDIKTELSNDDYCFDLPYDSNEFPDDLLKSAITGEFMPSVKRKYTKKKAKPKKKISKLKVVKKKRGRKPKNAELSIVKKENMLDCGLCSKAYKERSSLFEHLEEHKKSLSCAICEESFKAWPRFLVHRFNHIDPLQSRCHICWRFFSIEQTAEYHYYMKHYDGEFPGLQCKQCPKMYKSALRLRKHVEVAHSTKRLVCDHCSKVFKCKPNLVTHLKSHSDKKGYFCGLCDFTCKFSSNLAEHKLRKHTTDKKFCSKCGRIFQNQLKLDNHLCSQGIMCASCGKTFKTKTHYMKHSVVHTGVRKFKCDRCPATFKWKGNFRSHMNRHEGNRVYKCEFCDNSFYTRNVLNKHRRIHTGEKPFVCQICDKGFTGSHNLKVHMKVHGQDLVVKKTQ